MNFQVQRARTFYAKALDALPAAGPTRAASWFDHGGDIPTLLDEIERDGFQVLDRRIALTPLRKAWIAWTTSWSY